MFRTLKVFCHYQGKKSQLLRLWFSSNYKEDERVFILKTESCLWLGGSIKLYMIKWSSQMNENVADEREVENTYLVLFTSFSSFLCSASLENERQIFPSAFSRLLCPFLSLLLAKKKHQKRMGSRRKEWSIPPTHTQPCQWHFHQDHISSVASALLQDLWHLPTPFNVGWSCFLLLPFLGCLPIHWLFSHLFHISNQLKLPLYHLIK